ncbi:MAG: hypothetical protein K6F02_04325 [Prevotella sp.]|nr:hypothetical protein [Prevotella sp.]
MKRTLSILVFLLCGMMCSQGQTSQTSKVVEELNKRQFWTPYVNWLQSDDKMEDFLREMPGYNHLSLNNTLREIEHDHSRAQQLLQAEKEIAGDSKGKKRDKLLAARFSDIESAKKAFDTARQAERRYEILKRNIQDFMNVRSVSSMPSGALEEFHYVTSNGFAGYRKEVVLKKVDGKGQLLYDVKQMLWDGEDVVKEPVPVAVEDSVFQRVRDMVEEGSLYDISKRYTPDVDITDASNWSLEIALKGGIISSDGYAVGPDHSDTLNNILNYLNTIYEALTKKEK